MPIIEIPEPDSPITQGDIIEDVTVFGSKLTADGWESSQITNRPALVLSRPCVAANRAVLTVGLIKIETKPLRPESVSDAKGMLKSIRDGDGVTSQFYLGQLPNHQGRANVSFDPLYAIMDVRPHKEQLKRRRVARVCSDFMREIHLRLFYAVAHEGFDDENWYSDNDLQFLIETAKLEIKRIDLKVEAIEADANAGGPAQKAKEQSSINKKKDELNQQIEKLEQTLSKRDSQDWRSVRSLTDDPPSQTNSRLHV